MARIEIRLPQSGMGMTDGTIMTWHKGVGDRIVQGELLCEIEAAKAIVEMEAPSSGVIVELLAQAGENIAVNTPILLIDDSFGECTTLGAKSAVAPDAQTAPARADNLPKEPTEPMGRQDDPLLVQIEPRARRAAKQHQVDLALVRGSGPKGRIVEEDVLRRIVPAKQSSQPAVGVAAVPEGRLQSRFSLQRILALHRSLIKVRPNASISLQALLIRAAAVALADANGVFSPVDVAVMTSALGAGRSRLLRAAESLTPTRMSAMLRDLNSLESGEGAPLLWVDLDVVGAHEGNCKGNNHALVIAVSGTTAPTAADTMSEFLMTVSFEPDSSRAAQAGCFLAAFRTILGAPMTLLA